MKLQLAGSPPTEAELDTLPAGLRPTSTREDLTKEEKGDWNAMEKFANTAGVDKAAEVGFLLYVEQRRRTRTWVVGCSVAAASLGVLAGFLAWGRR